MLTEQPERAIVFACADRNAVFHISPSRSFHSSTGSGSGGCSDSVSDSVSSSGDVTGIQELKYDPPSGSARMASGIQVLKLGEPARFSAYDLSSMPTLDEHTWPQYTSGSLGDFIFQLYPSGESDALILADGLIPPAINHPIVAVVPPRVLYSWWLKPAVKRYYSVEHHLPVPSEDDVLGMHRLCYPHLDEGGVRRRLQLWGPVPSRVLGAVTDAEQRALWERAKRVSLDHLMAVGFPQGHGGLSRRIDNGSDSQLLMVERTAGQDAAAGSSHADIRSGFYFFKGKTTIASPALLRMVAQRIQEQQL